VLHSSPPLLPQPKMASRHGRQFVMRYVNYNEWETCFSVAKESRLSSMTMRHNFEVSASSYL
jgi:hypothetical protein